MSVGIIRGNKRPGGCSSPSRLANIHPPLSPEIVERCRWAIQYSMALEKELAARRKKKQQRVKHYTRKNKLLQERF